MTAASEIEWSRGVLQAWGGRGIGRALMQAREQEGVKRHSRNIDGRYFDELRMSNLLAL